MVLFESPFKWAVEDVAQVPGYDKFVLGKCLVCAGNCMMQLFQFKLLLEYLCTSIVHVAGVFPQGEAVLQGKLYKLG